MIDEHTDISNRKWEFEYVRDFDRHGNDYVEIQAVWQVVGDTSFEVEFDIIDSDWITRQEDRIGCEAFGYQVHS